LLGTVSEDLILTVSDMEKATIYFFGIPMAEWDGSDMYARVQTVTLPAAEINARGGTIHISTKAEKNTAIVEIKDNGEGIAEKDLPQIFERYFKSSRADTPRSSGLGLFIAREIVQHHHGSITVSSEQGKDSCFEIRLPLLS